MQRPAAVPRRGAGRGQRQHEGRQPRPGRRAGRVPLPAGQPGPAAVDEHRDRPLRHPPRVSFPRREPTGAGAGGSRARRRCVPTRPVRHTGPRADLSASELATTPVDQAVGEAAFAGHARRPSQRNGFQQVRGRRPGDRPRRCLELRSPPSTRALDTADTRGRSPATRASKSVAMRPPVCAYAVAGATKARVTARSAERRAMRAIDSIRKGRGAPRCSPTSTTPR